MGFNKALLEINGRPLIQTLAELARKITDEVFISANDAGVYAFLGLTIVPDVHRGQGPMAGLHAAFARTSRSLVLLMACDLPNLHEEVLRSLIDEARDFDAVVPRTADGHCHPLCGVYRRTCLPVLESNLLKGMNKATDLLHHASIRVRYLDGQAGNFSDRDLKNLNTPEDLDEYRSAES